jgi:hypothetical protein
MGDIGGRDNLGKRIGSSGRVRDRSVPPALATVLLVGLTALLFILAALTFVSLTTGAETSSKSVNIGASPMEYGGVTMTIFSGNSVNRLVLLEVADSGSSGEFQPALYSDGEKPASYALGRYVARNVVSPPADKAGSFYTTRIIVRGTFDDGGRQVLLDTEMTFGPPYFRAAVLPPVEEDMPSYPVLLPTITSPARY